MNRCLWRCLKPGDGLDVVFVWIKEKPSAFCRSLRRFTSLFPAKNLPVTEDMDFPGRARKAVGSGTLKVDRTGRAAHKNRVVAAPVIKHSPKAAIGCVPRQAVQGRNIIAAIQKHLLRLTFAFKRNLAKLGITRRTAGRDQAGTTIGGNQETCLPLIVPDNSNVPKHIDDIIQQEMAYTGFRLPHRLWHRYGLRSIKNLRSQRAAIARACFLPGRLHKPTQFEGGGDWRAKVPGHKAPGSGPMQILQRKGRCVKFHGRYVPDNSSLSVPDGQVCLKAVLVRIVWQGLIAGLNKSKVPSIRTP